MLYFLPNVNKNTQVLSIIKVLHKITHRTYCTVHLKQSAKFLRKLRNKHNKHAKFYINYYT